MAATPAPDPISRLTAAGLLRPDQPLAAPHREVLERLSAAEVETLVTLQERLQAAAETRGHALGTTDDDVVLALF